MSGDNHAHGAHGDAPDHGSRRTYLTGFALSVILTAIPFWLVMAHVIGSPQTTGYVIMAFALVQVVVHMVYFLHMNSRSEGGWNMMALIFTIVVVGICLMGSLWVMAHMNANMMPGMMPADPTGEMTVGDMNGMNMSGMSGM